MLRVNLFKAGVLAALGMSCAVALAAPTAPKIGVQLWSVKNVIQKDFEGTLVQLAGLGFQGVEFAGDFGSYGKDPAGLKAFLDRTGLACAGAHTNFEALSDAKFDATVAFYKAAGCTNLIIAMDNRAATRDGAVAVAKELSVVSAKLKPLGMKTGYHNHEQEMAGPLGKETWHVIAKGTPRDAILQQDVGWTTYAGKDPVAMVKRYPGRSVSTHYKPKFAPGTSGTYIIGQDKTDWAGVTRAARSVGGTEWIIIEQSDYPPGMGQLDTVAASMRGLQAILATLPK